MSVAGAVRKTARKVTNALTPAVYAEGDMDILTKLKQEHREVQALLEELVDSASAAQSKATLRKIKAALVPHARAEEKIVYDPLRKLKDKDVNQDGEEGYLEHALADKVLLTLSRTSNAGSPEFKAAAKVLRELLNHHIREEESAIWSDVKNNFSDEQRHDMNRRFEAAKKKVKIPQ
ncbi:MAG: hemerythrin domain-containing protein [Alphaproteobacteria bacterium]|nr:hemerythrin domain-containing protein [Alphaproteobacteria bacterium]